MSVAAVSATVSATVSTTIVDELSKIVNKSSTDDLRRFHAEHPDITLTQPVLVPCMCGCSTKFTALDCLDLTTVSKEFIDALFELKYITDPMILCDLLSRMGQYTQWPMLNYIVSKFDKDTLGARFEVKDKDVDEGYEWDPLSAFYQCHAVGYYGKIHPGARECYDLLIKAGCVSRYSTPRFDETKRHFFDTDRHVKEWREHDAERFEAFSKTPEYAEWLKL